MKIVPVGPTLLIKILPDEKESVKAKNFDIPDSISRLHNANATRGEVVSISPDAFKEWYDGHHWCKVGDIVYVKMHSGIQRYIDGELYRVVEDKDLWAIEEEN